MLGKLARVVLYLAYVASLAYYLFVPFSNSLVDKLFITSAILLIVDALVFIVGNIIRKAVGEERDRYELRIVVSYAFYFVGLALVAATWIQNPESLIIGLGIMGASLVIVFQEPFLSIGGFVYLVTLRPFVVGDRIEVDGKAGDVVDVGLFNTKIMEIKGWVGGDQVTGRLIVTPNSIMLKQAVYNYTKDFEFIWDEIMVPVTYQSNWKKAIEVMLDCAKKSQEGQMPLAEREIQALSRKYFFKKRDMAPQVYVQLTDNWISLRLRYITLATERRKIHNDISMELLKRFAKEKIKVASETLAATVLMKRLPRDAE